GSIVACLVCGASIGETHLGVDACRACAGFFKRSKLAGRKYACRQGSRRCEIRKNEKFMCRSCRYEKCVELGMHYDIPPPRRPRRKRVPVPEPGTEPEPEGESPPSISPSSSSSPENEKES
ncbi:hypothetical protein PFISCL1PPCAC_13419, partial [Pristionchus fissidentatus]